jgi:ADP-heptose:LPS heptosyltransferase
MVSRVLRIPYHFHNHHAAPPGDVVCRGDRLPTTQRDLDGVYSLFSKQLALFSCRPPDFREWPPDLAPRRAPGTSPEIVLGVVAGTSTKRWPLESFARLSQLIYRHDPSYRIVIPVSDAPSDQRLGAHMDALEFAPSVARVQLTLAGLADRLDGSLCYVGNDTGLKHICAALNVPTVTLFGPEDPAEWHPYDRSRHPVFFEATMPCRYEESSHCLRSRCDSMICLTRYSPEEVAAAVIARITA